MTFRHIVLVVLVLVFCSCKKNKKPNTNIDSHKIYQLADAGWKSKKVNRYLGGINYTVTEVPLQYYILKDQGRENLQHVDSIYKAHDRERVLEIEFHHDEEKDLLLSEFTNKNYEESVKYMAFKIQKDFKAITSSKDTISCLGVQFERNFKVCLLYTSPSPRD